MAAIVAAQESLRRLCSHGVIRAPRSICYARRENLVNIAYSMRYIGSITRPALQAKANIKKSEASEANIKPTQPPNASSSPTSSSVLSSISKAFAGGSNASSSRPAWMQPKSSQGQAHQPAHSNPLKVVPSAPAASSGFATHVAPVTARSGHSNPAFRPTPAAPVGPPSKPAVPATAAANVATNSMSSAVDAFKRMREEFAKLRALKEKKQAEGPERSNYRSSAVSATHQKPKVTVGISAAAARIAAAQPVQAKTGMFGKRPGHVAKMRLASRKLKLVHVQRLVQIRDDTVLRELAHQMGVKVGKVMSKLEDLGETGKHIDDIIEPEVAEILVQELGHKAKRLDTRRRDRVPAERPTNEEMISRSLPRRPCVVSVMGHVDHGKTTLLDALRGANTAAKEAGGITQAVAAFGVNFAAGSDASKGEAKGAASASFVTFLDTPGHALFASMRQRGAAVTDVVVLVVDGKDGVMPQTVECVKAITSSNLNMIVAVTKCDVVDADSALEKVAKELLEHGVVTEKHGGESPIVAVSAKTGTGLQDLKDILALQSEVLDLRADPTQAGEAMIIDSKVMKGSGIVLDCIVQWGTIKVGDIVVAGGEYGRIKALMVDGIAAGKKPKSNEDGALVDVQSALPGSPVRVLGLKGLPAAGEQLLVVDNEERAKAVIDGRQRKEKAAELASVSAADAVKRAAERDAYNQRRQRKVAYETALQRERKRQSMRKAGIPIPPHLVMEPWESAIVQEGREGRIAGMDATGKKVRQQGGQQQDIKATHDTTLLKEGEAATKSATVLKMVPLLAKADSSASLAAVEDAVTRIVQASHEAYPKIVNSSVGELSEKDVQLAADMGANIVCFNAKIPQAVSKSAEKRKVQIRSSRVIYHLLDEICDLVAGQMTPVVKEEQAAIAEVKALFNLNSKKADVSKVAGCVIVEGTFSKSGMAKYNVIRDGEVVGSATELASLMHLKDKVDSVKKGAECGMMLDGFAEVAVGDKIVAIKNVSIKPKLEVRFD